MLNYLHSQDVKFPSDIIERLKQFGSVPGVRDHCVDGAAVIWLARAMARSNAKKLSCVTRAASEAAIAIDALVARLEKARLGAGDPRVTATTPAVVGYFHAQDELTAAAGTGLKTWEQIVMPAAYEDMPEDQRAYEEALTEARELAARVLRERKLIEEVRELGQ